MAQATTERVSVRGADQTDSGRVLKPGALDFLRDRSVPRQVVEVLFGEVAAEAVRYR
jgi:hypothetical protein